MEYFTRVVFYVSHDNVRTHDNKCSILEYGIKENMKEIQ